MIFDMIFQIYLKYTCFSKDYISLQNECYKIYQSCYLRLISMCKVDSRLIEKRRRPIVEPLIQEEPCGLVLVVERWTRVSLLWWGSWKLDFPVYMSFTDVEKVYSCLPRWVPWVAQGCLACFEWLADPCRTTAADVFALSAQSLACCR